MLYSARVSNVGRLAGSRVVARARQDAAFAELCSWIDFWGGHVHRKLDLASTSLGCRGVVAIEPLTEEDQVERPVMVIPDTLAINADVAVSHLDRTLAKYKLPSIRRLPHELQVALFLASERKRGPNSRFHPYIESMPAAPPSGWLMTPDEANVALKSIVSDSDRPQWLSALSHARSMYDEDIQEAELFIDVLELDVDQVRWALGQAVSRAYGDVPQLIPALDCVNHGRLAQPPIIIVDDNGRPMTALSNFDLQWNLKEQEAGEELLVNYASKLGFQCTALEMFIDYGFVPEELLEGGMAPAIDDEDFDVDLSV